MSIDNTPGRRIEATSEGLYRFWCPGCDIEHTVTDAWQVDLDACTITPSVLVHERDALIDADLECDALTAPANIVHLPRCHSFVTDNRIQFLPDSTHSLAGQTVYLPWLPYPEQPDHYYEIPPIRPQIRAEETDVEDR